LQEAATSAFARINKGRKKHDQVSAASETIEKPPKPKRSRHEANVDDSQTPAPKARRGKEPQASLNVEDRSRKRREPEGGSKNHSQSKKRRRVEQTSQLEDEEESELEDLPAYQQLIAVTRKVSRQTIDSKWEPLPPGCIDRIAQLMQDIQRPVVVHLNDEHRIQANTALQRVSRRLISKISKGLPFPQGTRRQREDDFDFEKILDHNRTLEALLTPAIHANSLLEAELTKEMSLLEADQDHLVKLEANAKTEATMRKHA